MCRVCARCIRHVAMRTLVVFMMSTPPSISCVPVRLWSTQLECEARGFQFQLEGEWDKYIHLLIRLPESEAGRASCRKTLGVVGRCCGV